MLSVLVPFLTRLVGPVILPAPVKKYGKALLVTVTPPGFTVALIATVAFFGNTVSSNETVSRLKNAVCVVPSGSNQLLAEPAAKSQAAVFKPSLPHLMFWAPIEFTTSLA